MSHVSLADRVGDGEHGHAPGAPYDRIIVTAGAWDLPTSWADQLAPGSSLSRSAFWA
jgi:protein-L-isoaspartate(D-aspartate) O-methyltransferase